MIFIHVPGVYVTRDMVSIWQSKWKENSVYVGHGLLIMHTALDTVFPQ